MYPNIFIKGKTHTTTVYLNNPIPEEINGNWQIEFAAGLGVQLTKDNDMIQIPMSNIIYIKHKVNKDV